MDETFTLAIIKPCAVKNNQTGPILSIINKAGFRISCIKSTWMTRRQAEKFYAIHRGRDFFAGLVEFMSSGYVIVALLEKDNAVEDFRKLIGSTDPQEAADGTIRKLFGQSTRQNAIHGSDCAESAREEYDYFFPKIERF